MDPDVPAQDEEFLKILYNSVINSIDNSKGFFFYVGSDFTGIVKYNRRTMLASQILPFGIDNVGRDEQGNERSALQIEEYVTLIIVSSLLIIFGISFSTTSIVLSLFHIKAFIDFSFGFPIFFLHFQIFFLKFYLILFQILLSSYFVHLLTFQTFL